MRGLTGFFLLVAHRQNRIVSYGKTGGGGLEKMSQKVQNTELKIDPQKWYGVKFVYRLGQAGMFPVRSINQIVGLLRAKKLRGVNIQLKSRQVWRIKGKELLRYMGEED